MTQFKFVLKIAREPGNQQHGAEVAVTYDSECPAVSIKGTPYPSELRFINRIVDVCEAQVRGQPVRIVRGTE